MDPWFGCWQNFGRLCKCVAGLRICWPTYLFCCEQAAAAYDKAAFIRFRSAALLNLPSREYAKETQHLAGESLGSLGAWYTSESLLGICRGSHFAFVKLSSCHQVECIHRLLVARQEVLRITSSRAKAIKGTRHSSSDSRTFLVRSQLNKPRIVQVACYATVCWLSLKCAATAGLSWEEVVATLRREAYTSTLHQQGRKFRGVYSGRSGDLLDCLTMPLRPHMCAVAPADPPASTWLAAFAIWLFLFSPVGGAFAGNWPQRPAPDLKNNPFLVKYQMR